MKSTLKLIVVAVMFALSSCTGTEKPKEAEKVDSLKTEVTTTPDSTVTADTTKHE